MRFDDRQNQTYLHDGKIVIVPRGAINTTTKTVDLRLAFQESLIIPCTDRVTPIVAANGIMSFRVPYKLHLLEVVGSLVGAASTGTFTVDVNSGNLAGSILSTKLTFDATERTSRTAPAVVISHPILAQDDEIVFDIDDDGAGDALGLIVTLIAVKG